MCKMLGEVGKSIVLASKSAFGDSALEMGGWGEDSRGGGLHRWMRESSHFILEPESPSLPGSLSLQAVLCHPVRCVQCALCSIAFGPWLVTSHSWHQMCDFMRSSCSLRESDQQWSAVGRYLCPDLPSCGFDSMPHFRWLMKIEPHICADVDWLLRTIPTILRQRHPLTGSKQ